MLRRIPIGDLRNETYHERFRPVRPVSQVGRVVFSFDTRKVMCFRDELESTGPLPDMTPLEILQMESDRVVVQIIYAAAEARTKHVIFLPLNYVVLA